MPHKKRKIAPTLRVGVFSNNETFLPLITLTLTTQDCEILPVNNTLSPAALRELRLDLCIIDLSEPALNAHIFMRRLPGTLPIIAVTSEVGREFEFAEIFDVLTLPIDAVRLIEDIDYLRSVSRIDASDTLTPLPPTDAEIEQFSDFFAAQCGLYFDRRNRKALERGIQRRMRVVAAPSVASYFAYLQKFLESRQEFKKLVSLLTIGETSFFRFDPHFSALTEQVIPELIRRNQRTRTLRIWSAGCSTGEEVYSLAITLRRHFPQLADWEITILGTDINKPSLTAARAGIYRERALRHVPPDMLSDYFTPSDTGWQVVDTLRNLTRFSFLNLQSETYPHQKDGTTECDIIFCRNVMIYFRPETVRAVVGRLRRALRPGGYLFLGHAETLGGGFLDFVRCQHHGGIYYQAGEEHGAQTGESATRQRLDSKEKHKVILFEDTNENVMLSGNNEKPGKENSGINSDDKVNNRTASPKQTISSVPPAQVNELSLDKGFQLADQGHLQEALLLCQQFLQSDDLSPRGYFLRGLIHDQLGESQRAAEDFQRAIMLDIKAIMAHYHLAHVYRRLGRKDEAQRSLQSAIRLLSKLGESETIPDAKDSTVAGLLKRCTEELQQLGK